MRYFFEKTLGLGLAVLIVALLGLIAAVLFGGAAIGLLGFIIGFPMAFPLTTALFVTIFILIFLRKRK